MMHATLATLIMYYGERFEAQEMHSVLAAMRDAYRPIAAPHDDAHMVLKGWGSAIKAKFDADNLHLTGRETHAMSEKVLAVVQQLGATVGRLQAQMSELNSRMASFESTHEASVRRIELALGGRPAPSAGTARVVGAAAGGVAARSAAPARGATWCGGICEADSGEHSSPLAAAASPARPQVPTPVGGGLDRHDVTGSLHQEEYKLGGLHGGKFYLDCMANFGNLPINLTNDRLPLP